RAARLLPLKLSLHRQQRSQRELTVRITFRPGYVLLRDFPCCFELSGLNQFERQQAGRAELVWPCRQDPGKGPGRQIVALEAGEFLGYESLCLRRVVANPEGGVSIHSPKHQGQVKRVAQP